MEVPCVVEVDDDDDDDDDVACNCVLLVVVVFVTRGATVSDEQGEIFLLLMVMASRAMVKDERSFMVTSRSRI